MHLSTFNTSTASFKYRFRSRNLLSSSLTIKKLFNSCLICISSNNPYLFYPKSKNRANSIFGDSFQIFRSFSDRVKISIHF
ncbi:hypothetical protein CTM62_04275 [Prevotella intermedia]|uniref:Uncharacterized protein n=1 Tax=Prevotella intermedia TaxID=28131 RepID=A0A2D3L648_PREIN|nr:hypothetical protein CTM62_04275 [Prevotella intermedia]